MEIKILNIYWDHGSEAMVIFKINQNCYLGDCNSFSTFKPLVYFGLFFQYIEFFSSIIWSFRGRIYEERVVLNWNNIKSG